MRSMAIRPRLDRDLLILTRFLAITHLLQTLQLDERHQRTTLDRRQRYQDLLQ